MKITESVGNRREIRQPSTKMIALIPPDEIKQGSVTWRQKKNQGKQWVVTTENSKGDWGTGNSLDWVGKYFYSTLSLKYTDVRGSALGKKWTTVHHKEETASTALAMESYLYIQPCPRNPESLNSRYRVSQRLLPVQKRNKTLTVVASEDKWNTAVVCYRQYLCVSKIHMLRSYPLKWGILRWGFSEVMKVR